jgi:transcriptional regulator with XRE-family HTH domain
VTEADYGRRLRDLRGGLGLSLRQVEERGGPSKDVLSPIERGLHKPRAQTLGKIARAFEMSPTQLRTVLENKPEPPPRSVGQQLQDSPEGPVNLLESWEHELSQGGPERPPVLISLSRLDNKLRKAPPGERLYLIDRLIEEESSETNRYWLRSRRERVLNGTYRPMRPNPQTAEEAGKEAQALVTA